MATPEEIAAQYQEPVDEVSTEQPEEPVEQVEEVEQPVEEYVAQPDLSADESTEEEKLEAARRGWKEDGVDKHGEHRTAKEFLERGNEISRIMQLERQLEQTRETVDLMKQHTENVAKNAYERAIEDFKKQKLEAAEIGDTQKMLEIDEQMEKMEKPRPVPEINTEGLTTEQINLAEAYKKADESFKTENEWYGTNRVMTAFAQQEGASYAKRVKDTTGNVPHPDDVFNYVRGEIAKEFPDYKKPIQRVTSTQNRSVSRGAKKKGWNDVDDAAREIGKKLISRGAITEEKYLKDYFGE